MGSRLARRMAHSPIYATLGFIFCLVFCGLLRMGCKDSTVTITPIRLLLIHGHELPREDIRTALTRRYRFLECGLDELALHAGDAALELIFDAPLETEQDMNRIRNGWPEGIRQGRGAVFITERPARALSVRAHALGAECIVPRPVMSETLFGAVDSQLARRRHRLWAEGVGPVANGLEAGTAALERLFDFARRGTRLTQRELFRQGDSVVDTLGQTGLGQWVEAVRAHHSQTFRHSLLVTGIAVGFGQQLRLRREDLHRLALGGLVHDIGKAMIPIEILEKPATLTEDEAAVMRLHPGLGRDILRQQGGFSPELVDIVAHHHECLDGSGYPDGLAGAGISDIVRIMTIADIFAALIEQRSYKPTIPNEDAYALMQGMTSKLDMTLVAAFRPVALATRLAA